MTYPSDAGGSHPGYVAASGTSFAAPFATGAVGLLTSVRPELTDTDAQQLLRATADDVGDPGPDLETGAGRLNLSSALRAVGPEIGIWHDEVPATVFRELHVDTLRVVEPGLGGISAGLIAPAVLIEATATVAVPDSFVDSIRVWARVGGTTTLRRDFDLPYVVPWAEVAAIEPGRFTLRGYLYRPLKAEGPSTEGKPVDELPLPSSQARFGFTVMGRVSRGLAAPSGSTASSLRAWPNPFVSSVRVVGPLALGYWVLDVCGRRVRRLQAGSDGSTVWDGRDDLGRVLPAGLYWLAPWSTAAGHTTNRSTRVLKID
jgi:hypothetical protein